ncbi:MAG: response regulator, partial [Actinobacteria bacterium]|nr:response regulator [Actinomycetota bacterium]NIU71142.1 response regulator [Actinomycetota bacterium]NIW33097.1 response regulator [Actinomycetota bacterium]NIX25242.1 response regulator [Actinomycetota bacterium]
EGSVDLVLTDVVMPGLSGPELAERLAVDYPDTPVLFMSGYIDNEPIDDELSKEPGALLRK